MVGGISFVHGALEAAGVFDEKGKRFEAMVGKGALLASEGTLDKEGFAQEFAEVRKEEFFPGLGLFVLLASGELEVDEVCADGVGGNDHVV